jgi:hypothetical protein
MNNSKNFIFLLLLVFLILTSCHSNKFHSFNFIDEDYKTIKEMFFYSDMELIVDNIHLVEKKDTLSLLVQ